MELKINTLLQNKYRILSILGSGGFGITYLAEHELLGQKVAIKEFFMNGCVRAEAGDISYQSTKKDFFVDFIARFKTEAQTLAKFKHPSIVRVTDIFEENGTSYFVMDCIEGQTLKDWVQQNGAMPVKLATNYLKQLIGALKEVHAKDMLHRDIKPDNIMISDTETAVLIDFGAARNFISEHTKSNTGIHTPGYAPIEQYGNGKLDARTDIYGLSATFYFALTGKKPIDAISRFPDDSLKALSQLDSSIPVWLSDLIMKGLSPDMKNRFSSVAEMYEVMGEVVNKPDTADKTIIAKQRTNHYSTNSVSENPTIFSTEQNKVKNESLNNKSTVKIGDYYQGGIVAYIYQPCDLGYVAGETHGLIVAPSDQGKHQWYNQSYTATGAIGTKLGTGAVNTAKIVASHGAGVYAAKICDDLVLGGYSDWFLPSIDELDKIYLNKKLIGGGFVKNFYWSSSESNSSNAWGQYFATGNQNNYGKFSTAYVRAVRAF